ncbi:CSEP0156 putative effector protein [Blumeria hordei DH14]|uniref:CSEP0156 putative effector protein n=1 Tax=Blumeria graminis f. sp. hordei (strain DH14) TaxID=546991 RepID=N1JIL5_BLUG1|nr:CSEP0156 putative effector protein [Blumeria hordei DH14]
MQCFFALLLLSLSEYTPKHMILIDNKPQHPHYSIHKPYSSRKLPEAGKRQNIYSFRSRTIQEGISVAVYCSPVMSSSELFRYLERGWKNITKSSSRNFGLNKYSNTVCFLHLLAKSKLNNSPIILSTLLKKRICSDEEIVGLALLELIKIEGDYKFIPSPSTRTLIRIVGDTAIQLENIKMFNKALALYQGNLHLFHKFRSTSTWLPSTSLCRNQGRGDMIVKYLLKNDGNFKRFIAKSEITWEKGHRKVHTENPSSVSKDNIKGGKVQNLDDQDHMDKLTSSFRIPSGLRALSSLSGSTRASSETNQKKMMKAESN